MVSAGGEQRDPEPPKEVNYKTFSKSIVFASPKRDGIWAELACAGRSGNVTKDRKTN